MKTIDTSLLRVAYEDRHPGAARTVLLHARCWASVGAVLARAG